MRYVIPLLFTLSLVGYAPAQDKPAFEAAKTKQAFLKLLDRPKVPADYKESSPAKEVDGLLSEHFSIASQKKADGSIERIPILLVRPAKPGKYPAMIVLHGTGGTKEGQRDWLIDFAKRGIIGIAIDARYHGERAKQSERLAAYTDAIVRAWRSKDADHEHPLYYDTCWDLWRTLDYLETREDIDRNRLGMLGISMGGIQTWLAASVDDRVQVAVPLIAVQSFRWSLENEMWQGRAKTVSKAHDIAARDMGVDGVNSAVCKALWNKVLPGILDEFDCPNLIRLFAGRALFIGNGRTDSNCPINGAQLAIQSAEAAFRQAGAKEKLKVVIDDVAHTVTQKTRQLAIEWCTEWLTKAP